MSDASDNLENDFMLLFFNATTWANVAQNNASSPVTAWAFSLHTSSPGEAGNQTTNEATYTGYGTRPTKLRASGAGGFTVTGGSASPADNVDFPAGSGG